MDSPHDDARDRPAISRRQRKLLAQWLPAAVVTRDHSWGLVGTTVLELVHDGHRYIAKAGDERDHHIARELRAHRRWLAVWTARGRAPELVHADDDAKLIVTRYLPGELVEGRREEHEPDVHSQAGELLRALHDQYSVADDGYGERTRAKALDWLAQPHRIPDDLEARLRAEVRTWPARTATVVPTHGDWQPRNWLAHDGVVAVIDFGRADLRPARTDLLRLAAQQFRTDPRLESAFLEGYGDDPREPEAWRRDRVGEAIATAVWAHRVGDEPFERQGHRMIADVLADAPEDMAPPSSPAKTDRDVVS